MRITIFTFTLVVLVSLTIWAQQPPGQNQAAAAAPLQGGQVTAADLAAIVARQPKDRNGNATFLQLAPFNVNMEHRVHVMQNASIHDKEAELVYVIDGGGTTGTDGKLINGNKTNAHNSTGTGIEGGTSKK